METKVIKPLLRSLFISYALSALFLGALAFAFTDCAWEKVW